MAARHIVRAFGGNGEINTLLYRKLRNEDAYEVVVERKLFSDGYSSEVIGRIEKIGRGSWTVAGSPAKFKNRDNAAEFAYLRHQSDQAVGAVEVDRSGEGNAMLYPDGFQTPIDLTTERGERLQVGRGGYLRPVYLLEERGNRLLCVDTLGWVDTRTCLTVENIADDARSIAERASRIVH
jgi:hypothetical protein